MSDTSVAAEPARKFGTFLGVFTPSVLTILGLIMYLRFGWVVGNAGLLPTVAIVLLANGITLITALSISAVATTGVPRARASSSTSPWVSVREANTKASAAA